MTKTRSLSGRRGRSWPQGARHSSSFTATSELMPPHPVPRNPIEIKSEIPSADIESATHIVFTMCSRDGADRGLAMVSRFTSKVTIAEPDARAALHRAALDLAAERGSGRQDASEVLRDILDSWVASLS